MFSYLLAHSRFKRAFKPEGEDFLYRKSSRSPAYRISREEHEAFLRTFTRQYWKYHLSLMVTFLATLMTIIVSIMFFYDDISDEVSTLLGYGFAAILLVAIILIDRRLHVQPLEVLGSREPDLPARSRRESNDDQIKSMSWPMLVIMSIVIFGIAWLTFPRSDFEIWWPIIWVLYFGVAGFNWGRAILHKLEAIKNH